MKVRQKTQQGKATATAERVHFSLAAESPDGSLLFVFLFALRQLPMCCRRLPRPIYHVKVTGVGPSQTYIHGSRTDWLTKANPEVQIDPNQRLFESSNARQTEYKTKQEPRKLTFSVRR